VNKKKVIVFSHERSGTHFLINTIALNFGYASRQIDLDRTQGFDWGNADISRKWLSRFQGTPVSNIFKSHHDAVFFAPLIEFLSDEYRLFYIYRDGRDVMTSFWRYLNNLAPGWGPQTGTVGEFQRTHPSGGLLQYQRGDIATMLERWVIHIDSWLNMHENVHFIAYEELYAHFDKTLETIAGTLDQPLVSSHRPGMDSPSSLPWRGGTGNWKQYFSEEDNHYFTRHTSHLMSRL